MYRIPLRIGNVDLEDDEFARVASSQLADLAWTESGRLVVAVLYADCDDPVGAAVQAARRITHALPHAVVHEVDQELVGASDIAHRVGVTREAVRLWADGKRGPGGFPDAVATTGSGPRGVVRLWRWAEVAGWLRTHYTLAEEEKSLSTRQVARVNAYLHRIKECIDTEWHASQRSEQRLVTNVEEAVPGVSVAARLPRHLGSRLAHASFDLGEIATALHVRSVLVPLGTRVPEEW